MPEISRGRALAYVLAALLILVVGGRYLLGVGGAAEPSASRDAAVPADPSDAALEFEAEPVAGRSLVVHVVGAVKSPGLYELAEGSRVDDAIERAGGPTKKAALEGINLAAPVGDGQQVVIPVRGDPSAPVEASPDAAGPVRLNSASQAELETLPGVGPVTAQRILDYREQHGGFTSIDELDAVPGIGPARLDQLRGHIQL